MLIEGVMCVCVCVLVLVCVGGGLVTKSCSTLCDLMDCSPAGYILPMGFSRQECWSGLLFPSPGDLPDSRVSPLKSVPISEVQVCSECWTIS